MKMGIDLGTSYSSAAVETGGRIDMIKVATGASAFGDSFSMPTAVYVDNGHILLGQAAINKRKISPSCFKSEFKRDLGTSTPYVLGEEEYLPEQLYTEIFLYFKKQAAEQTGEKIEEVYITHPANYGNSKKRLIEKAANNAGLLNVVLVDEPTAAAAGYSQKSRISDGDILLVYDLGGGTFDVAIIKKTARGYVHLTEPLGISQCGGIDFDRVIFEDIMQKIKQKGEFDADKLFREKRFTAALSEVCVQIKHQLSHAESHTEPIAVGFDYFEYTITRQEFENMIRSFVANTCEKIKDILKNSGLVSSDIDRVLLVGGSSRVPLVRRMVQETLQKDISLDADPELAVCRGALCAGNRKEQEGISKPEGEDKKPNEAKEDKVAASVSKAEGPVEIELKKEQIQKFVNVIDQLKDGKDEQKVSKRKSSGTSAVRKKPPGVKNKAETISVPSINSVHHESNPYGNTNGNNVNGGIIAKKGLYIYFRGENNYLYKMLEDGSHKVKLNNDSSGHIGVVGDWVYYKSANDNNSIYKIRTDGTRRTKISEDGISDICIVGSWIYYHKYENAKIFRKNQVIYKITTDGTNKLVVCSDDCYFFNVVDDWIYYSNGSQRENIFKIRTDGTKKTKLNNDKSQFLAVADGWIYYSNADDRNAIYKMRTDGTGREKLNEYRSIFVNVYDGWIYYCNYDKEYNIYRMDTDGKNVKKLNDNKDRLVYINAAGEWVYYQNISGGTLYGMGRDGKNLHIIS